MFDIGFWELVVIGVIVLLVIGPERLPGVARNVGLWVGRIRRYVAHVKRDIERELHADEVRQLLEKSEGLDDIKSIARETASVVRDTRRELDEAAREPGPGEAAPDPRAEPPERRVAHHAVDDDPFASSSLARVSPAGGDADAGQAGSPAAPSPADLTHNDDERSGPKGQP